MMMMMMMMSKIRLNTIVHSTSKFEVTHHVAVRTNADEAKTLGLRDQRRQFKLLGGVLTLANSHTLPLLHIPVLGGSISVLPEHNSNASGIMGFDCVGGWPGVWTPPR